MADHEFEQIRARQASEVKNQHLSPEERQRIVDNFQSLIERYRKYAQETEPSPALRAAASRP